LLLTSAFLQDTAVVVATININSEAS